MDLSRDNVPLVGTAETTIKADKLDRKTLVSCTVISNKSHLMKYHVFRKETIAHPIHLVKRSLSEGFICTGDENAYQTWNQWLQPPSHSREASSIFQKMDWFVCLFKSLRTHRYPAVTVKLTSICRPLGALGTFITTRDLRTDYTRIAGWSRRCQDLRLHVCNKLAT
jgi:hypothetical protein